MRVLGLFRVMPIIIDVNQVWELVLSNYSKLITQFI